MPATLETSPAKSIAGHLAKPPHTEVLPSRPEEQIPFATATTSVTGSELESTTVVAGVEQRRGE